MSIPDLDTALGTLFDYDLNVYHLEEQVGLDEDNEPVYEYTDQWYVDIYEHLDRDQLHVAGPFKIDSNQRDLLELGNTNTYFSDDDSWYGMWGFLADYEGKLLPSLLSTLQALPKYKQEVLF
jgi:hypothetical protein